MIYLSIIGVLIFIFVNIKYRVMGYNTLNQKNVFKSIFWACEFGLSVGMLAHIIIISLDFEKVLSNIVIIYAVLTIIFFGIIISTYKIGEYIERKKN